MLASGARAAGAQRLQKRKLSYSGAVLPLAVARAVLDLLTGMCQALFFVSTLLLNRRRHLVHDCLPECSSCVKGDPCRFRKRRFCVALFSV